MQPYVIAIIALITTITLTCRAGIAPQTITGVSVTRNTAEVPLTTNNLITSGASLLFTNITLYSDASGSVAQNLTGLTNWVGVGDSTTQVVSQASTISAAAGTFAAFITNVPHVSPLYWQVKSFDGTNTFYSGQQVLNTRRPLW